MRKKTRLVIASGAVVLVILIIVAAIFQAKPDDIGEDEVRAMVMERYGGEIEAIETKGQHSCALDVIRGGLQFLNIPIHPSKFTLQKSSFLTSSPNNKFSS